MKNKPLSILQVVPYFYPAWAYGGIPRVVYELSRELVRKGHRVTVYTTDVLDSTSRCDRSGEVVDVDGIEVHYFRNASNRLAYDLQLFLPRSLAGTLRDHIREFDVIHLHGHRNFLNNLVRAHALRAGLPYILSAHGTAPRIERRIGLKVAFDRLFGDKVLRDARRLVAVSDREVTQYTEMGVPVEKVRVIYNGLDVAAFQDLPARNSFRIARGLGDKKIVLYLGKITPRKGIDFLLRAFALAGRNDTMLVIAGNDMGFQRRLEALVKELSLDGRVQFTGLLVGREKLAAYRDADVVVYPAIHEIFGLVPFEALLAGAPIIVTDDCGCGEIIGREGLGELVRYNDDAGLADRLCRVLDDPTGANERVERGRRFIAEKLNWDVIGKAYISLYREIETDS